MSGEAVKSLSLTFIRVWKISYIIIPMAHYRLQVSSALDLCTLQEVSLSLHDVLPLISNMLFSTTILISLGTVTILLSAGGMQADNILEYGVDVVSRR